MSDCNQATVVLTAWWVFPLQAFSKNTTGPLAVTAVTHERNKAVAPCHVPLTPQGLPEKGHEPIIWSPARLAQHCCLVDDAWLRKD